MFSPCCNHLPFLWCKGMLVYMSPSCYAPGLFYYPSHPTPPKGLISIPTKETSLQRFSQSILTRTTFYVYLPTPVPQACALHIHYTTSVL